MDLKLIKKIALIAKQMQLSELEVCDGDQKIIVKRAQAQPQQAAPAAAEYIAAPVKQEVTHSGEVDFNDMQEIKSPMIGVYYSAPSPDSAPFVSVGETVKKGQVLCIVEAMKVMNEITSEYDGEVIDICVKNGDIVEYGQTLFKIY